MNNAEIKGILGVMWHRVFIVAIVASVFAPACHAVSGDFKKQFKSQPISTATESTGTQIIVLGSGTPLYDTDRAGASIALIYKGEVYLFDVGPGSMRNAFAASVKYGIPNLKPHLISRLFFTHLHSDHTMDYVELANSFWWRRHNRLKVWGPKGLKKMTSGMYDMMATDRAFRIDHGIQPVKRPDMYRVDVVEIDDGFVYRHDGLVIEAFRALHGGIKPALSYKITAPDLTAVISGDTRYNSVLEEKARGVDFLFHEVISESALRKLPQRWQEYHKKSHTLSSDLGKLAARAQPGTLVIYHGLLYDVSEDTLRKEIRKFYDGQLVLASDLERFSGNR